MKKPVFTGSCTALISPFCDSGIDYDVLSRLLELQVSGGTSAIVLAGTTGENATLEIHEFKELVDFSVEQVGKRMKIIVGIGGNNTAHCLEKAKIAAAAGADALLMSTPYYNKTSQNGLIKHFCTVADSVELPLILYNVPSRTGMSISAETYKTLSRHPNINGVKEASGDFSLILRTVLECGSDLNIWSGNDDNTIAMYALGAKGVISVLSNVLPEIVSELCLRCAGGDFSAALDLYRPYARFTRLLFCETNPIPVKAAMELLQLDSGKLRLPLVEISPENREKLKAAIKEIVGFSQ